MLLLGPNSEELDSDDLEEEEEFEFLDSDEESDLKANSQGDAASWNETTENLQTYMNEMDHELSSTTIGKSFTNQKKAVRLNLDHISGDLRGRNGRWVFFPL